MSGIHPDIDINIMNAYQIFHFVQYRFFYFQTNKVIK